MKTLPSFAAALAISAGTLALPAFMAPAAAAVDASDPGRFVGTLADEGFKTMRGSSQAQARTKFRQLLSQHFAVAQIGDRLLGKWRAQATPAQLAAYRAAFPDFIINTYADNLYAYANADLKVLRVVPRGTGAAVMTQVTKPGASRPFQAIWTVERPNGRLQVTNLNVAGVNLAVTQAADFDAYISRNGMDKFIAWIKSRA